MSTTVLAHDRCTIHCGNSLDVLKTMPDESAHCCVTSPPYWGLRDYGTAEWEGGDEGCDHFKLAGGVAAQNLGKSEAAQVANVERSSVPFKDKCGKCGATRIDSQLGLESTPEEYVSNLVAIFGEVKRVLRDDGTLWLNLGDCYHGSGGANNNSGITGRRPDGDLDERDCPVAFRNRWKSHGDLKPKDLVGIPWMVAFALRADGWWLRQDIIWHKPNPMPSSVTDRCTTAHEYIFLLSKSATYYYDHDAIKNPPSEALVRQVREGYNGTSTKLFEDNGVQDASDVKSRIIENAREKLRATDNEQSALGSNKRSVWTVTTKSYAGAHFATFPPDLIRPCILAGTSEQGCCAECGAPWEREVERTAYTPEVVESGVRNVDASRGDKTRKLSGKEYNEQARSKTIGWQPTCKCDAEVVPCTVLDPLMGSGTTAQVALELDCNALGIELNPEYCELIKKRLNPILEQTMLF